LFNNPIHNHLTGHAAISKALEPYGIGVATGEHCQNRVIFKQFFQAKGFQFCQIDSCRMGGLNEVLAVLLMAAKFGGICGIKSTMQPFPHAKLLHELMAPY